MYRDLEALETELSATHNRITRKPWNVREGDIIVLSQYGMGFMNSGYMPVEVTLLDHYAEYHRSEINPTPHTKISHKTFRFWHKAMHESDKSRLINWNSTYWYSYDDVEVWREK